MTLNDHAAAIARFKSSIADNSARFADLVDDPARIVATPHGSAHGDLDAATLCLIGQAAQDIAELSHRPARVGIIAAPAQPQEDSDDRDDG